MDGWVTAVPTIIVFLLFQIQSSAVRIVVIFSVISIIPSDHALPDAANNDKVAITQ